MMSELERNAYHEAGHALVSSRLGLPVRQVILRQHSGSCTTDAAAAIACTRLSDLIPRAAAALIAGRVCERLLGLDPGESGPDEERLLGLLRLHHRTSPTRAEMDRVLEQGLSRAELILRSEWGTVRAIADRLLRIQVLTVEHLAMTLLETDRPEVLIASVGRLLELAKLAGDEPYLARSRELERLTRAACDAENQAEMEALEAELEAHAKLAAETPHRAAMETLAAAHKHRSGPTTVKGPVDAAHAAWLDRITRGKPPRRRPVTRTRPGWIGA